MLQAAQNQSFRRSMERLASSSERLLPEKTTVMVMKTENLKKVVFLYIL